MCIFSVFLTGSDRIPILGMKAVKVSQSCREGRHGRVLNMVIGKPFGYAHFHLSD